MTTVDINCDMGEGFGKYSFGHDEEMMRYISSANIACGFHAGDHSIMNRTVQLALEHSVSIGAHPSLPDRQGFGRRQMQLSPQEAYEIILYQVGALQAFVTANGGTLRHVKPHGALYNMAAADAKLAEAIAKAIYDLDSKLILFGLANSELIKAGEKYRLRTANEVFADRTYQANGSLTPRTEPNALITDENEAVKQAMKLATTVDRATICLHGDEANALQFAQKIHHTFIDKGIKIQRFL